MVVAVYILFLISSEDAVRQFDFRNLSLSDMLGLCSLVNRNLHSLVFDRRLHCFRLKS